MAQAVDRAQIPEILLDMSRSPAPGKLVHMIHEPPNAADALIDRVELKVPGQLLIAAAREHFLQRLLLWMQQLNSTQLQHTPGPIDRHYAPKLASEIRINDSSNASLEQTCRVRGAFAQRLGDLKGVASVARPGGGERLTTHKSALWKAVSPGCARAGE